MRWLIGMFLMAHGVLHFFCWGPPAREDAPIEVHTSAVFGNVRVPSTVLAIGAGITLIVAGVVYLTGADWWRVTAIAGATLSFAIMLLTFTPWWLFGLMINVIGAWCQTCPDTVTAQGCHGPVSRTPLTGSLTASVARRAPARTALLDSVAYGPQASPQQPAPLPRHRDGEPVWVNTYVQPLLGMSARPPALGVPYQFSNDVREPAIAGRPPERCSGSKHPVGADRQRRVPTESRYSFSKWAGPSVARFHLSQNASSAASNSSARPSRSALARTAIVGP